MMHAARAFFTWVLRSIHTNPKRQRGRFAERFASIHTNPKRQRGGLPRGASLLPRDPSLTLRVSINIFEFAGVRNPIRKPC